MPPQGKTVLELPWRLSFPPLLRPRFRPSYAKPTKRPYRRALHLHHPSAPAASTLTPPPPHHHRPFTTTSPLLKKGGKQKRNTDTSPNNANSSAGAAAAAADNIDPFDTSGLETSIQKAIAKLEDDLSKLRVGGQFNPEVLEGLRVQVGGKGGKGSGGSGVSVRLDEVAQILPRRGRSVVVVVAEREVGILFLVFVWLSVCVALLGE
jgi:ribosome recycling factor